MQLSELSLRKRKKKKNLRGENNFMLELAQERHIGDYIEQEYTNDRIQDTDGAVLWLCALRGSKGFSAERIMLVDGKRLPKRSNKHNDILCLHPKADVGAVIKAVNKSKADNVLMSGRYFNMPIVIRINVSNFKIALAVDRENFADIIEMKKQN
jgi:hypothetical protein